MFSLSSDNRVSKANLLVFLLSCGLTTNSAVDEFDSTVSSPTHIAIISEAKPGLTSDTSIAWFLSL